MLNGMQMEMCTGVLVIGCLMLFLAGGHLWPLFSQHVNHSKSSFWSALPVVSVVCKKESYLAGERLTLINENRGCKTPGKIPFPPASLFERRRTLYYLKYKMSSLVYSSFFWGVLNFSACKVPRILIGKIPVIQIFVSFSFMPSLNFQVSLFDLLYLAQG